MVKLARPIIGMKLPEVPDFTKAAVEAGINVVKGAVLVTTVTALSMLPNVAHAKTDSQAPADAVNKQYVERNPSLHAARDQILGKRGITTAGVGDSLSAADKVKAAEIEAAKDTKRVASEHIKIANRDILDARAKAAKASKPMRGKRAKSLAELYRLGK